MSAARDLPARPSLDSLRKQATSSITRAPQSGELVTIDPEVDNIV